MPASENFPNQTINILRQQQIKISDPDIIATTGWTTSDLSGALTAVPPRHTYSFVSLLIGVNNQYQGRSIDEYNSEFTLLVRSAINYAGNRNNKVYVLSIPDYSVTAFSRNLDTSKIAREIDSYNVLNKTIATQLGVNYLDITQISREAKNNPSFTAIDGLHPSGIQYKKWADLLALMITQG